jgi:hypothetical protein
MILLCVGGITQIGLLNLSLLFLLLPFLSPSSSAFSPPIFVGGDLDSGGRYFSQSERSDPRIQLEFIEFKNREPFSVLSSRMSSNAPVLLHSVFKFDFKN